MTDLSKHVVERDGVKVVDSRKLHAFLGVQSKHGDWMQRKIASLDLVNNKDYYSELSVRSDGKAGRRQTIFWLTQRAAEHLGMAETTEVGTQIRDAFIAARDARRRQLETEFDRKSKDARKGLASQWAQHGLVGSDFGRATVHEYETVFGDKEIRKAAMDKRQKALLTIFEFTEELKLESAPHINGLVEVKESMDETGRALESTFAKLRIAR